MPMADRMAAELSPKAVGKAIAMEHGWSNGEQLLVGSLNENIWLTDVVPPSLRPQVLAAAVARYRASPQVAAVFTANEIAASPLPHSPPETWTLLERVRASFNTDHSGDLVVLLKPRITPIAPGKAEGFVSIATHGSPWDYDRRVPILFWRKGMTHFEQPVSVETVDIMPTFAALVGLRVDPSDIDGRCLDLEAGANDSCK